MNMMSQANVIDTESMLKAIRDNQEIWRPLYHAIENTRHIRDAQLTITELEQALDTLGFEFTRQTGRRNSTNYLIRHPQFTHLKFYHFSITTNTFSSEPHKHISFSVVNNLVPTAVLSQVLSVLPQLLCKNPLKHDPNYKHAIPDVRSKLRDALDLPQPTIFLGHLAAHGATSPNGHHPVEVPPAAQEVAPVTVENLPIPTPVEQTETTSESPPPTIINSVEEQKIEQPARRPSCFLPFSFSLPELDGVRFETFGPIEIIQKNMVLYLFPTDEDVTLFALTKPPTARNPYPGIIIVPNEEEPTTIWTSDNACHGPNKKYVKVHEVTITDRNWCTPFKILEPHGHALGIAAQLSADHFAPPNGNLPEFINRPRHVRVHRVQVGHVECRFTELLRAHMGSSVIEFEPTMHEKPFHENGIVRESDEHAPRSYCAIIATIHNSVLHTHWQIDEATLTVGQQGKPWKSAGMGEKHLRRAPMGEEIRTSDIGYFYAVTEGQSM